MWLCIDWYSHGRHLQVLNGASLYQRLKFIHDWQCTNSQKFKFTKSDDASIGLHAARQPLRTMITLSAVPLRRAPATTWSCKIFTAQLNKQHHQLALFYGQALHIG
jgi:hypothetical protein